ncbi:MAG: glycosyltransferase family 2 protein [Muribaculaceae bacterium]|nr:glycosyltransferase family 2 protein [Muribaculaceae bacterium]
MENPARIPMVSIVVPNYNYARYLKERMDSIFNQTFTDYEIILLDDASTDNSVELLTEYAKDPRVSSLVINERNTGLPFLQWKRGIEAARGKYVWIAESDDKADPEFLATCVKSLERKPEAVLAFAGSTVIDSDGNPTNLDYDCWKGRRHLKRIGKTFVYDGYDYVIHNMAWKNYVYNASDTVFRRSAFDGDKDYNLCFDMRNAGDHLFWTIMMKKGKVIEIYRKLNYYRRHDASQTAVGISKGTANGQLFKEETMVLKYIFNNFPIHNYRKAILGGHKIKTIKRSKLNPEAKALAINYIIRELGISPADYYIDRVNKFFWNFIPGLIALQSDRL